MDRTLQRSIEEYVKENLDTLPDGKLVKSENDVMFRIPIIYEMFGWVNVSANSVLEAEAKILFDPSVGLPEDASYIDDSISFDKESDDYPV